MTGVSVQRENYSRACLKWQMEGQNMKQMCFVRGYVL